jgi:hypothetical protein
MTQPAARAVVDGPLPSEGLIGSSHSAPPCTANRNYRSGQRRDGKPGTKMGCVAIRKAGRVIADMKRTACITIQ